MKGTWVLRARYYKEGGQSVYHFEEHGLEVEYKEVNEDASETQI